MNQSETLGELLNDNLLEASKVQDLFGLLYDSMSYESRRENDKYISLLDVANEKYAALLKQLEQAIDTYYATQAKTTLYKTCEA